MALKEILDKIQKALPADADSGLRSLVADAINEASVVVDSIGAKNRENEKLRSKLEEAEAKIEELSKGSDVLKEKDAKIAELETFKTKWQEKLAEEEKALRTKWEEQAKMFQLPETDKRYAAFQKVKGHFQFGDDKNPLDIDAIKANLKLFDAIADTGVITSEPPADIVGGKPPVTTTTPPVYSSSGEAIAAKLANKK